MRKINFIVAMLIAIACLAQNTPIEYLKKAKEWSEVKLYDEAIRSIEKGLEEYPQDYDLKSYEIRVLLWQENFEEANERIEVFLAEYPNDYQGLQLKATLFWWKNEWNHLKEVTNLALSKYPKNSFFQEKKLIALLELKEYKEANHLAMRIEDKSDLAKKLTATSKLHFHQRLGVAFNYSQFDNTFSPWKRIRASYHREAKNSFNIGLQHGNMFDEKGMAFDANLYPSLGNVLRGVLDVGGSNSDIFPRYRIGGEFIADIKKIELGVGSKLMRFKSSENPIYIHTASLGLSQGNYYLSYKAYLTQLDDQSNDITNTLLIRRNFSNRFNYLQLNISRGSTPLVINNFSEISRLEAKSVRLSYHTLLLSKLLFNTSFGIQEEKYTTGTRRRIDGYISLSVIF